MWPGLLGSRERRSRRRAEAGEQLGLPVLSALQIRLLDVAKAADVERQPRQFDSGFMVLRRQRALDLVENGLVLGDQAPLGATLGGMAERVERGAAQPTQPRESAKRAEHPVAVDFLLEVPGGRIALGQQRRRQMKAQFVGTLELLGNPRREIGLGIKP